MAIASVEVIPYSLPFKQPYETARGSLERREMVLLRLRGDDGSAGLGEAVPAAAASRRASPAS
jgi:L-alanine-DL-glutamate epimerase-like enolase superfamily enzyme